MKIYKVKVNGKVYEVELEAVEEKSGHIETTEAKQPAATTAAPASSANSITAPIAGKVTDIKVNVGDVVKEGQTVMIIEAMKLENEIQSAYSGKVTAILVKTGDDVRNKDVLITLG